MEVARNPLAYELFVTGMAGVSGYISAWFAAGPNSILRDHRIGALAAVSIRVTDLVIGRQLVRAFPALRNDESSDASGSWEVSKLKEFSARFAVAATLTIIAMNSLGYPMSIDEINVLSIGAIVGVPSTLAIAAAVIYLYRE